MSWDGTASWDRTTRILTPALVVAALVAGLVVGARWHERIEAWLPLAGPHAEERPPRGAESPVPLWTCSMHPSVLLEGPGRCPICDMELTPIRATAAGDGDGKSPGAESARPAEPPDETLRECGRCR